MNPGRWLKFAPVVLLPFLAAYAITSGPFLRDLEQRSQAALEGAGASWAKLTMDGRDARLAGDAPSSEAIAAGLAAVAAVPGIRTVRSSARVVPQPAATQDTTQ